MTEKTEDNKNNLEENKNRDIIIPDEIKNNQHIYTEHIDEEYARGLAEKVMKPISDIWFRTKLVGWDETPERNNQETPLIFATNHSGMAFPWDAMLFAYKHTILTNFSKDSIRALTAPMLSASALMNPFTINGFWKKIGAIDATFLNFETMMFQNEKNVLVYPEGVPGIGKGFNNKYKLQELKTSFLRMSIKHKTDVFPFFCINGEYINPYSYNSKQVTKFINKIGIPFLPLGIMTLLLFLQPWLFYFGFPAQLTFVRGRRISPYKMTDKPYDEISQEEFKQMSAKIRKDWQEQLSENVKKYGKKPFDLKGLFKKMFKNLKSLPYALPSSWVILFHEYHKQYKKHGNSNFELKLGFFRNIWLIIKNPFLFFYFLPVIGWIPIAIKGYKGNTINKKNKKK